MPVESLSKYSPQYVKDLFNEMSKTYGIANYLSSFGFTEIWRKQCVDALPMPKQPTCGLDLMSGMGESWSFIQKKFGSKSNLVGIDISEGMNRKATEQIRRKNWSNISSLNCDVFRNDIPAGSQDFIISTFGLKTFNHEQLDNLAREIKRLLKPGGTFSCIEVSVPSSLWFKPFYLFYLNKIVPIIGKVFLNNEESYKMLGYYTVRFRNSHYFYQCLEKVGLESHYQDYFFGCASGVYGRKK